ncbi:NAD-dependent epimerase/dehydratase family protein [Mycolicibacterium sp. P1-18]|uniref:NAD-dependent epimerase/dehydratase family protein n=1 Tax=Mycolicibacterium sp. P1-18 TaxID=2024615 RepID=UPI0011F1D373|nr:NAD-dependent epimerase/dehydratase family protein [Mycolicibacterium sp. P1-18]KAA0098802.1 NAD-dependent epimerase/dehydratase family protein [Mycolicibacterium sp. P1-18]
MKCVVTGAAGFIGSSISSRLLSDGHDVVGVDCFTDYYDVEIKRENARRNLGHQRFRLIEDDLNVADLASLVMDAELIFHQAGQPGVRKSWGRDFDDYVYANISATQRLLEAVKDSAVLRKFVYASSSSIYGNAARYPTSELDTPHPISPYGVTKLAAEHLCTLYAANYGTPTVSLRYFTVYGPRQRTDMAFTRFVRAAVRAQPITIFGDGNQIRDFTYIDDVVEANIAAATVDCPPGSVFNVAGGSSTTIREVLERLADLAGPLNINYTDAVAGDVLRTGGSTRRIEEELGWRPSISLQDGLARQFEWGRAQFQV